MVTHDPRYETYADRTIRLFDGRIVEESVRSAWPRSNHGYTQW